MKKKLIILLAIIGCIVQAVPVLAKPQKEKISINAFHSSSNVENDNDYERQIVKVNGENMSYIQLGNEKSNKSIVIIHGSAFNARAMVPYGKIYADTGYNVILVDLPGHYENISKPKSKLDDLADSVASLINELVKEKKLMNKSEVQGWSLGASVALDVGIRHPDVVQAIGIIDGASNYDGLDLGSVTEEIKLIVMRYVVTVLKSKVVSQDITNELISELPNVIASADAINSDYEIDKVLNIDNSIGEIKVPVYDFYGGKDVITSLDKQNEMMYKIKKGQLYVADGYNHLAVLENPKLVYDAFETMRKPNKNK